MVLCRLSFLSWPPGRLPPRSPSPPSPNASGLWPPTGCQRRCWRSSPPPRPWHHSPRSPAAAAPRRRFGGARRHGHPSPSSSRPSPPLSSPRHLGAGLPLPTHRRLCPTRPPAATDVSRLSPLQAGCPARPTAAAHHRRPRRRPAPRGRGASPARDGYRRPRRRRPLPRLPPRQRSPSRRRSGWRGGSPPRSRRPAPTAAATPRRRPPRAPPPTPPRSPPRPRAPPSAAEYVRRLPLRAVAQRGAPARGAGLEAQPCQRERHAEGGPPWGAPPSCQAGAAAVFSRAGANDPRRRATSAAAGAASTESASSASAPSLPAAAA